jgi:hypothetical protein
VVLLALSAIAAAAVLALGPQSSSPAEGQEGVAYVGAEKCKMCHGPQHKAWQEMKHSNAWAALNDEQIKSGKDEKGRACISCHSTGYGKPTGFESVEKTPDLVNVGCEACHGPGKAHMQTMMMAQMNDETPEDKKISKNVGCTTCHNPHISYKKLYGK